MEIKVNTEYNIWDIIYYKKKIYTDKLSYSAQQFVSKFSNLAEIHKWYIGKIDVSNNWDITYWCWPEKWEWCHDMVKKESLIWDIEKTRLNIISKLVDFFDDNKMEELLKSNSIRDRIVLYIKK
jgi:hypothetical protein